MENNKPGCLGAILKAFGLLPKNIEPVAEVFPYLKRDDFLSPAELSFYKILYQAVGGRGIICPKVSLKDIFFVQSGDRSKKTSYENKIDRKHVDFLICSADRISPICGIELDDSSHKRADRMARDQFVEQVYKAAGLKLIRFDTKRNYSLAEVKQQLEVIFGDQSMTSMESPHEVSKIEAAVSGENLDNREDKKIDIGIKEPLCPKCGVPMVRRVAKTGVKKGQSFYGCSNYPKCRETVKID